MNPKQAPPVLPGPARPHERPGAGRAGDAGEGGGGAWLTARKDGRLAGLREVTCDMWDAYAEATREVFGDAVRVTVDRFHVMKALGTG